MPNELIFAGSGIFGTILYSVNTEKT